MWFSKGVSPWEMPQHPILSLIFCDSSEIGVFYIVFSFLGGLLGFSFSMVLSMELGSPFLVLGESFYYVSLTGHGIMMVFYFLTTLASGFSSYLVPNLSFLDGMVFPSISAFSFWLVLVSFGFVFLSLLMGGGVSTGWTLYAPLSGGGFSEEASLDLAVMGIHGFSMSSVLNSMNLLATMVSSLESFESVLDVSVFVWSFALTSFLVMFSTPSLACVLTMLLSDSNLGTFYFCSEFGGDPMLFQTMFWFWGHPEVYILMLPVFGIISQMMKGSGGGGLYNSEGIIFSMVSLTVLSFLVWGHHMATVGWGLDSSGFFMTATMVMSIPTGVKIFSWLFSLCLGPKEFSMPVSGVGVFILMFSFGGVTGVFLSNASLDVLFHDTYFVVAHFHMILANASIFGFLSGLFFFWSSLFNLSFSFWEAFWFFGALILTTGILFMPLHVLGFLGLPSSVSCYPFEYFLWFYISTMGFFGVWLSVLLFIFFGFMTQSTTKSWWGAG